MPFPSLTFLFIFLPASLLLYFILPFKWWRNGILLIASLFFFAWGDPVNLILLIAVILFNWLLALAVYNAQEKQRPILAKTYMVSAVVADLLVLMVYKYSGFVIDNLHLLIGIKGSITSLLQPLGISFFTFSAISYIVDVYQGTTKTPANLIAVANYLAMFPKILQGPITRYKQVEADLAARKTSLDDLAYGSRRFVFGLAKKVLIADNLATVANRIFGANFASIGADLAWYAVLSYALYIYFDFSGYTDMAVGLGRILGFHLPENFNFPYISRSITEFWRRWHMTLIAWFRSYVFLPLEFARKREKHFRQQSNILIVFLLTGLWHGANWNFILWGVYFGIILALEASFLGKWLKKIPLFLQHLYTILLFLFGWVFFKVENITTWGPFFKALFGGNGWSGTVTPRTLNVLLYWPLLLLAIIGCTPIFTYLEQKIEVRPAAGIIRDVVVLGLLIVSVAFILSSGFQAFEYARF
jgi:alginate O-acetyltransferase complex protein AlgI